MADMTPLERATEAVQDAILALPAVASLDVKGDAQALYGRIARAVLTAIRKPATDAVDDAQAYINGARWDEVKPEAEMVWEIMLDATLSDDA